MRYNKVVQTVAVLCSLGIFLCIGGCTNFFTSCVAEGTLIATPSGNQPIETLVLGDEVWSSDAKGKPTIGMITAVHRGYAQQLLTLNFDDGSQLRATPEHLIATNSGWSRAGQLTAGDATLLQKGKATITTIETRRGRYRVYDLTVEPTNTYFADGVLVHNKSFARGMSPVMRDQPITFATPQHRYWIELMPAPGRAFRISHYNNEIEQLEILSWQEASRWDIEIVMRGEKPAKIEVDATVHNLIGTATIREYGKTIAENVAFLTVRSQEQEFELLRQTAADANQASPNP